MRSRLRSFFAVFGVLALAAATMVVLAPAAVADSIGPVDASIPDGDTGSLRDVIENQIGDGDTVVLQSGATYQLTCEGGGALQIEDDVTIQGNGATIEQTCDELVLDVDADLTLDGVTITGGFDDDNRAAGGIHMDGSNLTITNSSIVDNQTCGEGGAITYDTSEGVLSIRNSTIAGNSAAEGGAIASHAGSGDTTEIVNSTITGNSAEDGGGIVMLHDGPLDLTYSTVVANAADQTAIPCESDDSAVADDTGHANEAPDVGAQANGTAANVQFDDDEGVLTSTNSVIALPVEGPNCARNVEVESAAALSDTVSNGYNYSDDASCGLTGTGDTQDGADPMLGALAANGGPTLTRLPAEGSPLIDGVAVAACHPDEIAVDQRYIDRPQRTACDIGAVEVVAITPTPTPTPLPLVITPRFTG